MAAFSPALFSFLSELAAHNDRDWFTANKPRYEADVKGPLIAFVRALAPRMATIDPEVACDDKSVFRIHRDTRFSTDKSPYKTHVAAQFAHGTVRGPGGTGYYLHLEPGACFFAAGLWMPEPAVAAKIRARIAEHPTAWAAAKASAGALDPGATLARVPKPFPADHPLADDLRRKTFTASARFADADVVADGFPDAVAAATARLAPLVGFLAAI